MKIYIKNILLVFSLVALFGCTPSAPYEIRSPCVSIEESAESQGVTPCVRRPINMKYAIV